MSSSPCCTLVVKAGGYSDEPVVKAGDIAMQFSAALVYYLPVSLHYIQLVSTHFRYYIFLILYYLVTLYTIMYVNCVCHTGATDTRGNKGYLT